jgi:hypothetical protein
MRSRIGHAVAVVFLAGGLIAAPVSTPPVVARDGGPQVPIFWLNADTDGSAGVTGLAWAPSASVEIRVNGELRVMTNTDADGSINLSAPAAGSVVEGDLVTVGDGTSTKTLTVTSLVVMADRAADTVSGVAPEGTVVAVGMFPSGPNQEVTANASGRWTADFSPASAVPYDIVVGTHGNAVRGDADGDATNVHWFVSSPAPGNILVTPDTGLVDGQEVTLSATGWLTTVGSPGRTLFVTQCAIGDGGSDASCDPTTRESFVLNPDGSLPASSTFIVRRTLAITWPSPGTLWNCTTSPCGLRGAVYAGDTEVASPGWETMELPSQNSVIFSPVPSGILDLAPSTNLLDGQEITLTGSNWPVGRTLHVGECRLDVALSPDSCDEATTQTYLIGPDGTLPTSPASLFPVVRNISASGAIDCGEVPCGLVGAVWPGEPFVGSPISVDPPGNNPIDFATVASAPRFVQAVPGDRRLTVHWTAPSRTGGSAIIDYVVQFRPSGGTTWLPATDGVSSALRATITGLRNGTAYLVRVAAVNAVGRSAFGPSAVAQTPRTTPTAPGQPTGTPFGSGRVALRWTAPTNNGGAAIIDYIVQFRWVGAPTWATAPDGRATATRATVRGLRNGVPYLFRVAAVNDAGWGDFSRISAAVRPMR